MAFVSYAGPIAQCSASDLCERLTCASRLTWPSIPPWVSKMSRQMMVIGEICVFQIGLLCQLGNQDKSSLYPVCSPGGDLRRGGSSS